jgi:hypothetical protein
MRRIERENGQLLRDYGKKFKLRRIHKGADVKDPNEDAFYLSNRASKGSL